MIQNNIKLEENTAIILLKKEEVQLNNLSNALKENKNVVLSVVKKNNRTLKYASNTLKMIER